jgi:hypothetical protein
MYDFDLKLTGEAFLTLKMDILIQERFISQSTIEMPSL